MSLTSILSDKNNQELRDKLKHEFIRPSFKLKAEIKAEALTKNWGIVGTAFDYLMRFYLQHHNRISLKDAWVADYAYVKIKDQIHESKSTKIKTGFHGDKIYNTEDFLKIITSQYEQTNDNFLRYIDDGILTNELIENTIFLAKLDVYFRAGFIDQNFDNHNPDDIKDLYSLISIVEKDKFKAKDKCYFNPTFGKGSILVGGADADLIIDNTLIDIKVTKHLILDRKYLNQIIGYYVLSLIGGVNDNTEDKPIEKIGIYFARHGILWSVPVSELGDEQTFENFKNWLESFIRKKEGKSEKGTFNYDIEEFLENASPTEFNEFFKRMDDIYKEE